MKKITKIIAIVMLAVMVSSVFIVSFADSPMNVSASNVITNSGEDITINVNISNNTGAAILRVTVEYDSSVLILKSCSKGDAAKSFDSAMLSTSDNPVVLSCLMNPPKVEENAIEANNKINGQLLSFTFSVASNAKTGSYPIIVKVEKCFDIYDNKVNCIAKSSVITINEKSIATEPTTKIPGNNSDLTTVVMGDADNSGDVTAADARFVLRISAQLEIAPDNILIVADTNDDKIITAADARKILRVSAMLDTF